MGADAAATLTPEEKWLVAAAGGDREALGALYDRFAGPMLAVAQRVLGSPREAEDLVHDVFLEAWHRARHYDRTRGSVQTWLMMRLRSRALDRLRSAQRVARLAKASAVEVEAQGPALVASETTAHGDARQVHTLLSRLSDDQRRVLEMAYFDGMALSAIADRLSLPLGTVKSRMSRAIAELRSHVRGEGRDA